MNKKWLNGLSPEQQVDIKVNLKESRLVLERLATILENELDASIKDMARKDNYFLPAWDKYQAHKLGEQEALRRVLQLIEE